MIKKITALFLILILALSCACTKNEEEVESRTVSYDELGLTYTTPDEWREFEETNLYPSAYSQEGIFAIIDYSYVVGKDYEDFLSRKTDSLNGLLFPICKIVTIEDKNENHENVSLLFSDFDITEKAASQDGYSYYVLYDYNGSLSYLSDEDKAGYDKMAAAVPSLIESISVYPFDNTALEQNTENANSVITFLTKTLEGDDINSSVFADYDLTLFNIWGTNAYPDIDEHAVLQEVYEWIEEEGLKVNIIMAVTDTPSEENEEVALKAKNDADAAFTSIMLDQTLAAWITNNINGIPTTFLVDNEATIISDKVEGTQTAEFYKTFIKYALDNMNEAEEN